MKAKVFLATLGLGGSAVLVGQLTANPGLTGLSSLGNEVTQASQQSINGVGGGIYDVTPCRTSGISDFGKVGTFPNGTTGLGVSTTGQNVGTVQLPWYDSPDVDHPVIAQNMYRVNADGRMEQIGMSWLKHAWFAVQGSSCGSCNSSGTGSILGVGCADTYGAGLNADQAWLGPRWEIKVHDHMWMNGTSFSGSHFARNGGSNDTGGHNQVEHRLRVRMGDLVDPGASYVYESVYYLLKNHNPNVHPQFNDLIELPEQMFNNATHRHVNVNHQGNGNFSFGDQGSTIVGPAMWQWGDVQSEATPNSDGIVYVSSRAVDIGGGNYRYEYLVYNLSFDANIDEIQIPIGCSNVTNFGFHAPRDGYWTNASTFINESPYDVSDWTPSVSDGVVTFAAPDGSGGLEKNSIRYGTGYTFWFEADEAPDQDAQSMVIDPDLSGPQLASDVVTPVIPEAFVASLDDVTATFGTTLGGTVTDLEDSDDSYYRVRSQFGFLSSQPNVATITVGATSAVGDGCKLAVNVEGRFNNPLATVEVRARDWDSSSNTLIGSLSMGTTESAETVELIDDIDPLIRNSDGRVQIEVKSYIVATFTLSGYIAFFDQVQVTVFD